MYAARVYWFIQGMSDVPRDNDWLTLDERARYEAMAVEKRREEWRLGRWTSKRAVSTYLAGAAEQLDPASLDIRAAYDGAPQVIVRGEPGRACISISHRSGFCLCAVAGSDVPVGCDLEVIEPHSSEFIADYFTAEEQSLLLRTLPSDHPLFVSLIWSAKESALKVVRKGLRRDTRSMIVQLDPEQSGDGWMPLSIRCVESSKWFHGWWQTIGGFVLTITAAVVTDKPIDLHRFMGEVEGAASLR